MTVMLQLPVSSQTEMGETPSQEQPLLNEGSVNMNIHGSNPH